MDTVTVITADYEDIKTGISSRLLRIANLPPEDMKAELLVLAAQQQKREKLLHNARQATRKWRAKHHGDITVRPQNGYHGDDHGDSVYISKKESKEVSKKESNRRVSKKRSQIPSDLLCSARNISDALKAGMTETAIPTEWEKFRDHHLHKGTFGSDWNAGWRRWCQNHVDWKPKLSAKPLSPHLQHQFDQRRLVDETFAAITSGAISIQSGNPFDQGYPKICRELGSPANQVIPINGSHDTDAGFSGGSIRRIHGISRGGAG
jgi:hypothetical protein